MLCSHNTLLLDEPNNHLDLESVSALAWGLKDHPGTSVVVSHNRDLLDEFANKIISFEDDDLVFYAGTLEEYLKTREVLHQK